MTRAIHTDTLAALAGHFCPALLVEVDWPDGVVRMHSGFQPLTWGGHEWLPVGNFGRIDMPEEADGLPQGGATMTWIDDIERTQELLGMPFDTLRGRLVRVWFAVVTAPRGNVLVGAPVPLYTGYFDGRDFALRKSGDSLMSEMTLTLADGVPARTGTRVAHTAEDQGAKYPGDTAGRHLVIAQRTASNPQTW
ncbi:hypothetical protein [Nostoc phage Nsp-JY21]